MQKPLIVGLVLILAAWAVPGRHFIAVPRGRAVMVDGKISSSEWTDAKRIDLPHGAQLYFKQTEGYVYLCTQLAAGDSGFVDLYLSPSDGRIYDLHASAKLGQQVLSEGQSAEWKTWWNNQGWVANVSRVDSFDEKRFLPESVREFQIEPTYFPGPEWRVMIEISVANGEEYSTIRFPTNADKLKTDQWLLLDLK